MSGYKVSKISNKAIAVITAIALLASMIVLPGQAHAATLISSCKVETVPVQIYTGKEVTPKVTLTYQGYTLKEGTDYELEYSNNINPSSTTNKPVIRINGKGQYGSYRLVYFSIEQPDVKDATISNIADTTYSGVAITPKPTVSYNGIKLVEGSDYTLTYANNDMPGTATVTIAGTGVYKGSQSKTFVINRGYINKPVAPDSWLAHEGQNITTVSLAGKNREETNDVVVRETHDYGSDTVILASCNTFADALSGAPLAGATNAAIVLVQKNILSADNIQLLKDLGAKNLIVLGDQMSISDYVMNEAKKYVRGGEVVRLGGKDRYETNYLIYNYLVSKYSYNKNEIILTTGDMWADALSISSYAAWSKSPVILVNHGGLNNNFKAAFKTYNKKVTVCGDVKAVNAQNVKWFTNNGATATRYGGANREETSALIANYAISQGMDASTTIVSTSGNFPDALSGSQLGNKLAAPIILVANTSYFEAKEPAYGYFVNNDDVIKKLYYLGDNYSISGSKRNDIKNLLDAWKVTFHTDNNIETIECVSGQIPQPANTPTKARDAEFAYTFDRWSPSVVPASKDTSYIAKWKTEKLYKIIFKTNEGSILSTQYLLKGESPSVPSVSSYQDNVFEYTFVSWDKSVKPVTGDAIYTATFTKKYREYTVTWSGFDQINPNTGKISTYVTIKQTYHYGDTLIAPDFSVKLKRSSGGSFTTANVPQRQSGSYCFAGWNESLPLTVTKNYDFKPVWKEVIQEDFAGYKGTAWPTGDEVAAIENAISKTTFNENKWNTYVSGSQYLPNIAGFSASSLADTPNANTYSRYWRDIVEDKGYQGGYRISYYCLLSSS